MTSTFHLEIAAYITRFPQARAREILTALGAPVCLYTIAQVAQVRHSL